ncbi:hypothetical protein [Plantactinospora sp. CA-290183]|uniref:hypothetical protein n=1 Tax=Plantactinospora sp. CA-290183 TaxID=3240006 RepID=UPI003D8F6EA6
MLTPVQVDWLTLLLGPIVLISLGLAVFSRRSASNSDAPIPGWGKAAQVVGIVAAMLLLLIQIIGRG